MIYGFIGSIIALVLFIFFFVLFPKIKRNKLRKNYLAIYGKTIYNIANVNDYYLINKLILEAQDDTKLCVDHLLLGNKYIYIIKDNYVEGGVTYKINDESWIEFYGNNKNPKRRYMNNMVLLNASRVKKFSVITGLSTSLIISINIFNNNSVIDEYESDDKTTYIVKQKNLKKLIASIEGRDVAPLDQKQLAYAVKDIAKINLRK